MSHDTRRLHQLFKIGSARAGAALAGFGEPLDTLLPENGSAIEARLWLAIGALDLWQRSGYRAAQMPDHAETQAAAPDSLPPCPSRAEGMLALLLRGVHAAGLLSEWLQLLHRHGARLPARFLPNLLDAATRQPRLRPLVVPVLDERGHWLARPRPEWAWAANGPAPAQRALSWDTGSIEQRVATLHAWREDDPAAALQMLTAAWATEPPEYRAALLPALAIRLGPGDEDFIESALDDRRKEVRAAAQRLLAELPGSRLSQRMRARVQPLLQVEQRLLRPARLQLALPGDIDAPMRRDGIDANPWPGAGKKAGWVIDMLAAVDPQVWEQAFERTPRKLLALAESSEFAAALIRGWALASMRHGAAHRSPWLAALAHWWIGAKPALREAVPGGLFDVLGTVARHDEDATLSALVEGFPDTWHSDAGLVRLLQTLADHGAGRWPQDLSRRVLQRVETALPVLATPGHAWAFRQLLSSLALALDPSTAAAVSAGWPPAIQPDHPLRDAFDTFFSTVRFRHEMHSSFQEPV